MSTPDFFRSRLEQMIEQAWSKLPGSVLMFDERGVVILASQASWRYRPILPLSAQSLAEIATARPYGNEALKPLTWKAQESVSEDAQIVRLDDREYVATTRQLKDFGWQLKVMDDTAPVRTAARNSALLAALAMAVLWLLAVNQWQRQRALRHRVANQQALQVAYDSLESKVADRTAELSAAHSSLVKMQSERMHASKMVALGQMSAGVVHELNQPLAALRTLSDNACVLLEREQLGDVRSNLQRIGLLVDRLGGVTYQLTAFAHKTDRPRTPVSLLQVISNAQFLVSQRLREHGIEVQIDVSPADLSAMADAARLEQVIVNLLGNAIDAMASAPARRLVVEAKVAGDHCIVAVTDTGAGIREDIFPHVFEPFNTSKPAGTGLGLGLMISAHIVAEFEGRLQARNMEGGGACFVIELPLPAAGEHVP